MLFQQNSFTVFKKTRNVALFQETVVSLRAGIISIFQVHYDRTKEVPAACSIYKLKGLAANMANFCHHLLFTGQSLAPTDTAGIVADMTCCSTRGQGSATTCL